MKKNYLKPLCMTTPMRGLRLLEGSINVYNQSVTTTNSSNAIGLSRGDDNYDDGGTISPRSVWDD